MKKLASGLLAVTLFAGCGVKENWENTRGMRCRRIEWRYLDDEDAIVNAIANAGDVEVDC